MTIINSGSIGTPMYLAPEFIMCEWPASTAIDVRSIGITFIELFTEQDTRCFEDMSDDDRVVDFLRVHLMKRHAFKACNLFPSDLILRQRINYNMLLRPAVC